MFSMTFLTSNNLTVALLGARHRHVSRHETIIAQPLLCTKLIRSSTDFLLNSWQRDSQRLSLHNGRLTFNLFGTCSVLSLGESVVPSGVVPCVVKAEPLCSVFFWNQCPQRCSCRHSNVCSQTLGGWRF